MKAQSNPTTYVTKTILERIRSYETKEFHFNRALSDEYMAGLAPGVKLPVVQAFAHKQSGGPYDEVMRVMLVIPKNGQLARPGKDELVMGIVDMPIEDYLSLPVAG